MSNTTVNMVITEDGIKLIFINDNGTKTESNFSSKDSVIGLANAILENVKRLEPKK